MSDFLPFFQKAMVLATMLSLPSVLAATVIGTLIAFVQAIMQLQEQTLSFALKLITVSIVLVVSANWMGREMIQYTALAFDQIPTLGH